jgi:hypothetical protein
LKVAVGFVNGWQPSCFFILPFWGGFPLSPFWVGGKGRIGFVYLN